jgi:hypothetical protein
MARRLTNAAASTSDRGEVSNPTVLYGNAPSAAAPRLSQPMVANHEAALRRQYAEWIASGDWRDHARGKEERDLRRHRAAMLEMFGQCEGPTSAEMWLAHHAMELDRIFVAESFEAYSTRRAHEARQCVELADEYDLSLPTGLVSDAGLLDGEPPWLIEDFLPATGITLLHGLSDSMKSLVLLYILVAAHTGCRLFEKFSVPEALPRVLLISTEDTRRVIEARLFAIARALQLPPPAGIFVRCPRRYNFDSRGFFEDVECEVIEEGFGLVGFDAFGSLTSRADREPHRVRPVMERLRRLGLNAKIPVVLTAHDKGPEASIASSWPSGGPRRIRSVAKLKALPAVATLARISGGMSMTRYCDQVISLTQVEPHRTILVRPERSRQGGDTTPFVIHASFRDEAGRLAIQLRHEEVPDAARVEPLKRRVLRFLQVRGACSKNAVYAELGGQKCVLLACLSALEAEGAISVTRQGNRHVVCVTQVGVQAITQV